MLSDISCLTSPCRYIHWPMNGDYGGVYLPTKHDGIYESTPLTGAGWYDDGQHGGAIAALFAHYLETLPTLVPMQLVRITVEIVRVVPTVTLTLDHEVLREGKKIQLVSMRMKDPDGTVLAMATAQRLRVSDRPTPPQEHYSRPFVGPESIEAPVGGAFGPGDGTQLMFHRDAVEIREVVGGFRELGPGIVWVRMTVPLVAGSATTPTERMIAASDFGNGAGRGLDFNWVFMNTDLNVHIGREPIGEWIGLESESYYSDNGRGLATSNLWDTSGWVGRSTQSLFVDHAPKQSPS